MLLNRSRALFLFLCGLGLLLSGAPWLSTMFPVSAASPLKNSELRKPQLRVLCYNIHHGAGGDERIDFDRIARVILSVQPDIVMLQEVDCGTQRINRLDGMAELSRRTQLQPLFGKNLDFQGGEYGNGILTRFPIREWKNIPLPQLTDGEPRGLLTAVLDGPAGIGELTVCSTHLDHRRDDEERLAAVDSINAFAAAQEDAPMILAGDMNADFASQVYRQLEQEWTSANSTMQPTYPARQPRKQIDFIFFRKLPDWQVKEFRVLDEPVASDHCPVFVILEKQTAEPAAR